MKLSCTLPLGKSRYGVSGNALERVLSKSFLSRSQRGEPKSCQYPLMNYLTPGSPIFLFTLRFKGKRMRKIYQTITYIPRMGYLCIAGAVQCISSCQKAFYVGGMKKEGKIPTTSCQTNPMRYYPNYSL